MLNVRRLFHEAVLFMFAGSALVLMIIVLSCMVMSSRALGVDKSKCGVEHGHIKSR